MVHLDVWSRRISELHVSQLYVPLHFARFPSLVGRRVNWWNLHKSEFVARNFEQTCFVFDNIATIYSTVFYCFSNNTTVRELQ